MRTFANSLVSGMGRMREMLIWFPRIMVLACAAVVLSACGHENNAGKGASPTFHADENPVRLSEWGMYSVTAGAVVLSEGVVPYDLNSTLFTDYAHKLRTIWIPGGQGGAYRANDYPDLPVGTVISKTFYYARPAQSVGAFDGKVIKVDQPSGEVDPALSNLSAVRFIETRLLVRRAKGWSALSYIWNDEQTDAVIKKIGDAQPLTLIGDDGAETRFTYIVPNTNQCAGCHATNNSTRQIGPIGVMPRHLNKEFAYDDRRMNQIDYLSMIGYLTGAQPSETAPRNADWTDVSLPAATRARAYLDINCSHCHNPVGPADTSGLFLTLDTPPGPSLGLCKMPIAAGAGTGGRPYDIVPGDAGHSILSFRMQTTDPGSMMPELGRSLSHTEAASVIGQWIDEMEGECLSAG